MLFEHRPVVICQCVLPCFEPFREGVDVDGPWSEVGCMMPKGHAGDHGMDGTGGITYRDPPKPEGPRVVLRNKNGADIWEGDCHQCQRHYVMAATDMLNTEER